MRFVLGFLVASVFLIAGNSNVGTAIADFKSTFLIGTADYSTLSWMSDDASPAWRDKVLAQIQGNGDTHADVMARSYDKKFKRVDGVDRASWRARYQKLLDGGIAPVTWLISDDSPQVYQQGLANQIEYQNKVVDAVDDLTSHYVVCLECDEYYSANEVSVLIQNLRRKGVNKPIGVHLTPGMAGKEAYIKDADIIYLQTGFDKTDDQIRESVRYAISLGKPVVVSEYHKEGTSEEARRIGDLICTEFPTVVGTGNGRGSTTCASYAMPEEEESKWEKFHGKYDDELAVIMLAMITFSASTLITLPFQMQYNYANEDGAYEVLFAAPITETTDGGFTINESGRVMGFISGTFDKLFGEPNGDTRRNSDRR